MDVSYSQKRGILVTSSQSPNSQTIVVVQVPPKLSPELSTHLLLLDVGVLQRDLHGVAIAYVRKCSLYCPRLYHRVARVQLRIGFLQD